MKKSLFFVFLAFLCLFCTSAAFASSADTIIIDKDAEGDRSKEYSVGMTSDYLYLPNNQHYQDYIKWNGIVSPAEVQSDIFDIDLGGIEGEKKATVHFRMQLDLNDVTEYGGDGTSQGDLLDIITTPFNCKRFSISNLDQVNQDHKDFEDATNIIIIDAKGAVRSIAAQGYVGSLVYRIASDEAFTLDLPESFPLKIYAVSYSYQEHGITVNQQENGLISPSGDSGSVTVPRGRDQTFTVAPADGYQIAHLLVDGEEVDPDNKLLATYTFARVLEDGHTFSAVFEPYSGAEASAASGITATVTGIATSVNSSVVAKFDSLGFTTGAKTVNIADGSDSVAGGTFKSDEFIQAVTMNITVEDTSAANGDVTLTVPLSGESSSTEKNYYALVLNRSTNYYDLWPAALTADGLSVTVSPVSDYAPEAIFYVYSGTAAVTTNTPTAVSPSEGSRASNSGCNAGAAALALLVPVYFTVRRAGRR